MKFRSLGSKLAGSGSLTVAVIVVAVLATAATFALLQNITDRKVEGKSPYFTVAALTDDTSDPAEWGKNFPIQYEDYKKTVDQVRTRFGGSEAVPKTPTAADPRSIVAQSKIEEDPRLVTMWSGYAFSKDFREERGHAFMLEDQLFTERQNVVKQPGACLNCHASTYSIYRTLGNGDLQLGFDKMNKLPYSEAKEFAKHPVACIDCHEPTSLKLRITRPAFMEGIKAYKKSQGVENYDVNKSASTQEMRTFVCAQCHVEYHFKGEGKSLTYPWAKGLKVDDIYAYYAEAGFKDWEHKETGASVLKAQHPEFEMWSQGIHARSGVSCSDCHMPYKRVGAFKVSDHHVRSPVLNIDKACQTCHNQTEGELKARVEIIQERTHHMRDVALDALMDLITDIKNAKDDPSKAEVLKAAQERQRKAQFFIDFVEAENSSGFHAPQEAARIFADAINEIRLGQNELRK